MWDIMLKDISCFAEILGTIPDPRSKQGTDLPFTGILAIVFFVLLASQNYFAHIQRWTFNYWSELRVPLGFKKSKPPHATTLSRLLAKIRLGDLQDSVLKVSLKTTFSFSMN
jgi:hypothetical protein